MPLELETYGPININRKRRGQSTGTIKKVRIRSAETDEKI